MRPLRDCAQWRDVLCQDHRPNQEVEPLAGGRRGAGAGTLGVKRRRRALSGAPSAPGAVLVPAPGKQVPSSRGQLGSLGHLGRPVATQSVAPQTRLLPSLSQSWLPPPCRWAFPSLPLLRRRRLRGLFPFVFVVKAVKFEVIPCGPPHSCCYTREEASALTALLLRRVPSSPGRRLLARQTREQTRRVWGPRLGFLALFFSTVLSLLFEIWVREQWAVCWDVAGDPQST